MSNKIIVLGSLNMDLTIHCERIPENGETLHGHDFLMNEGGKGGNQAVAVAKQGSEVYFLGGIGEDLFGDRLEAALRHYGIKTDYLQRCENTMSGVATIIISEGDNRIILDAGANFKIDVPVMLADLEKIGLKEDIFITQFENSKECVYAGLKKAKELGMKTLLNPAPAMSIDTEMYQYIDILVVNQSECEILTGIYPKEEEECKKAMEYFNDVGIQLAIITMGTMGSYAMEQNKLIFVKSYKVENVDTTGAGDSYIGAFASGLLRGRSIIDCMNDGAKVAALTVTKTGAQSAIPYKEEVESYFKEEIVYE